LIFKSRENHCFYWSFCFQSKNRSKKRFFSLFEHFRRKITTFSSKI